MVALIDKKEVETAVSKMFLGSRNISAFMSGVIYMESEAIKLMMEFSEWCADGFVKANENMWFVNYTDQRDKANWRTTEQLLEQFLKSREK